MTHPELSPAASPVQALLSANGNERQQLWSTFVEQHSRVIMHACRSVGSDYDAVMDRYTHALEQLQEKNYERLRSYDPQGRGKFTTWLTVVVRRLCLDHHRSRYGRTRGKDSDDTGARQAERKRLVDLLGERVDLDRLQDTSIPAPDESLRRRQLGEALADAVGALEPRDRLVLAMRFRDDLSAREIAEVVGFPSPFHVYRRINNLLDQLRRVLQTRGVDNVEP